MGVAKSTNSAIRGMCLNCGKQSLIKVAPDLIPWCSRCRTPQREAEQALLRKRNKALLEGSELSPRERQILIHQAAGTPLALIAMYFGMTLKAVQRIETRLLKGPRPCDLCPLCVGEICDSKMYDELCCSCEDGWRDTCHAADQLALAVLHSRWKLSYQEQLVLNARIEDSSLQFVAERLAIPWKRALKIEWRLLAKIKTYPPERLPESAQRILAQRAWRQAVDMGKRSIQVEGNVIHLGSMDAGGHANG